MQLRGRQVSGDLLDPRLLRRGGCLQGCIRREGTSEAAPEAVGQAVGGGCQSGWGRYCRLQMQLKQAVGVRETVAGHGLGALEGGGGGSPLPMHPWLSGVVPDSSLPHKWLLDLIRVRVSVRILELS